MANLKWESIQPEFTGNWLPAGFSAKKIKPVCIYFKQSLRASHQAGWNRGAVRSTPPDAWGQGGGGDAFLPKKGEDHVYHG